MLIVIHHVPTECSKLFELDSEFKSVEFGLSLDRLHDNAVCFIRHVKLPCEEMSFFTFLMFFYSARSAHIASAILATAIPSVCLSVRPSVRPSVTPVLCQNDGM